MGKTRPYYSFHTATTAGGTQKLANWTAVQERVTRLEALDSHQENILRMGIAHTSDEITAARRVYKEITRPSQRF